MDADDSGRRGMNASRPARRPAGFGISGLKKFLWSERKKVPEPHSPSCDGATRADMNGLHHVDLPRGGRCRCDLKNRCLLHIRCNLKNQRRITRATTLQWIGTG